MQTSEIYPRYASLVKLPKKSINIVHHTTKLKNFFKVHIS